MKRLKDFVASIFFIWMLGTRHIHANEGVAPLVCTSAANNLELTSNPSKKSEEKCKNNFDKSSEEPPKKGNFSLPVSQQPGPFISFGQNIIEKGQTQIFIFGDRFIGRKNYLTDIFPGILYGISDDWSIYFNAPFSPGNREEFYRSSGLEDIYLQLEYVFYSAQNSYSTDQATVVGSTIFPTGSAFRTPPTGFGSNSFFIGGTYNHTTVDWLTYTSHGVTLTTSNHQTKFGNQFYYQFGFGRNIATPQGWIFLGLIEINGLLAGKNKIKNSFDPNSGGNNIFLNPSIWISSEKMILQFGVGFPLVQALRGDQPKKFMSFYANVGITL